MQCTREVQCDGVVNNNIGRPQSRDVRWLVWCKGWNLPHSMKQQHERGATGLVFALLCKLLVHVGGGGGKELWCKRVA